MVNVIVRVKRPYDAIPPLAMGLFVTVEFSGVSVPDAIWLPRSALHENNVVWIVDSERLLQFRTVEVVRFDGDEVLVTGITDGELIAVSQLRIVTNGMKVNLQSETRSER